MKIIHFEIDSFLLKSNCSTFFARILILNNIHLLNMSGSDDLFDFDEDDDDFQEGDFFCKWHDIQYCIVNIFVVHS